MSSVDLIPQSTEIIKSNPDICIYYVKPIVLDNNDLIACAQTGTGKTGAFVLPILNKLVGKQDSSIDTLVVVPTRELAVQIEKQIQGLSYFVSVGSISI